MADKRPHKIVSSSPERLVVEELRRGKYLPTDEQRLAALTRMQGQEVIFADAERRRSKATSEANAARKSIMEELRGLQDGIEGERPHLVTYDWSSGRILVTLDGEVLVDRDMTVGERQRPLPFDAGPEAVDEWLKGMPLEKEPAPAAEPGKEPEPEDEEEEDDELEPNEREDPEDEGEAEEDGGPR